MYLYQHSSPDPRCDGFTSTTTTSWQMEVKMGNGLVKSAKCEVRSAKVEIWERVQMYEHSPPLCVRLKEGIFSVLNIYIFPCTHSKTRRKSTSTATRTTVCTTVCTTRAEPSLLSTSKLLPFFPFFQNHI